MERGLFQGYPNEQFRMGISENVGICGRFGPISLFYFSNFSVYVVSLYLFSVF